MLCGYDEAADRYLLHDPDAACSGPIALCAHQVRCRGYSHLEEQSRSGWLARIAWEHTVSHQMKNSRPKRDPSMKSCEDWEAKVYPAGALLRAVVLQCGLKLRVYFASASRSSRDPGRCETWLAGLRHFIAGAQLYSFEHLRRHVGGALRGTNEGLLPVLLPGFASVAGLLSPLASGYLCALLSVWTPIGVSAGAQVDAARRAFGTDEDLLLVSLPNLASTPFHATTLYCC